MDEPPQPQLTIVEIRSNARGRQRQVVLSDGREFAFNEETCERIARCRVGGPWDDELFEELEATDERVRAHSVALGLLSSRARSQKEMRTRLAMRGIGPAAIDDEIERLIRAGLLDDEKFARAWVEDRKRLAPRGRRMLRYELLGRGIQPESVDLVTQDVDDMSTALELARGRARGSALESYERFYSKVGGFLQRRGFDRGVTSRALKIVWEEVTGGRPEAAADEAYAEFP